MTLTEVEKQQLQNDTDKSVNTSCDPCEYTDKSIQTVAP